MAYGNKNNRVAFGLQTDNGTTTINERNDLSNRLCDLDKKIQKDDTFNEKWGKLSDNISSLKDLNKRKLIKRDAVMDQDKIIISIVDSGKGMGIEQMFNLFKLRALQFNKNDGDHFQKGGMGLPISEEIVKKNNGKLAFKSV